MARIVAKNMPEHNYFLNPNPADPHYIARIGIVRALASIAERAKGQVLDIGSGEYRAYEPLFEPYVDEYVCLDRNHSKTVDICSDCYSIPLADGLFDVIVSTQVLEHLETPHKMLSEAYRLLKPNGSLVMTVPMSWGLHEEPYDFYRYTKYGILYLLEQSNFSDIQILPLEGLCASLIQLLIDEYHLQWLALNKKFGMFLVRSLNRLAFYLDAKFPTSRFCLTYFVTATKAIN